MKKIVLFHIIKSLYTYNDIFSNYVQQPIENIAMNLTCNS